MFGGIEIPLELKQKFRYLWQHLNEWGKRMVTAEEALQLWFGGIALVSRACGLSRVAITKAIGEINDRPLADGRIRRNGAGRHQLVMQDSDLLDTLGALVEPLTRGDSQSPLRWTCKSTRALSAELCAQNHLVSNRAESYLSTGPPQVSGRPQGERQGICYGKSETQSISWRMELSNFSNAKYLIVKFIY